MPLDAVMISTYSSLGSYCKFLKGEELSWKKIFKFVKIFCICRKFYFSFLALAFSSLIFVEINRSVV